ncbi:hypothetical protein [Bosea sp. BK604]|uniref:hypothetical protein n=1 Tax=Bosea sp. BK604 TaxID=2512180 RepID=UPI0010483979|nr:hypothetical protein [Bosea sp. BK604]
MFTIDNAQEYQGILKRLEKLKAELILDGAEAAEIVSLMAAAEEWEAKAPHPSDLPPNSADDKPRRQ